MHGTVQYKNKTHKADKIVRNTNKYSSTYIVVCDKTNIKLTVINDGTDIKHKRVSDFLDTRISNVLNCLENGIHVDLDDFTMDLRENVKLQENITLTDKMFTIKHTQEVVG